MSGLGDTDDAGVKRNGGGSQRGAPHAVDPFDDAMAELRMLIASTRSIYANATTRGVVTDDAVAAVKSQLAEAEELLRLQQTIAENVRRERLTLTSSVTGATKVAAGTTAAPGAGAVWLSREAAIVDAANELYEVSHATKRMISAFEAQQKRAASQRMTGHAAVSSSASASGARDGFVQDQLDEQADMVVHQDLALDRLHEGLQRVQANAVLIQDELHQQETLLGDAQQGIDALRSKLEAANQRVDVLLNKMSDCKKICAIVVLCVILGMLMVSVL